MSFQFGAVCCQHAGIHVHNLDETEKWYHEVLGFECIPSPSGSHMNGCFPKCRLMKCGDFYLEIYEVLNAEPFSFVDLEWTVGLKHLSFAVEDLDGLAEYLYERDDVKILVDNKYPEEMCGVPGGDRAMYILDNNGMLVELSYMRDRG